MASHHNHNAEGLVDIGAGVLLSIGSAVVQFGEPIIFGALGAVGSIGIRVIYKKWFKKYFEYDEGRNNSKGK